MLEEAGIRDARSVVIAVDRDDAAVLVTLTARELAPEATIVVAVREEENVHLLQQSGADSVISSSASAGRLLGMATETPGIAAVLEDLLSLGEGLDIVQHEIDEASAGPADPELREWGPVIAVLRAGELIHFNDERCSGSATGRSRRGPAQPQARRRPSPSRRRLTPHRCLFPSPSSRAQRRCRRTSTRMATCAASSSRGSTYGSAGFAGRKWTFAAPHSSPASSRTEGWPSRSRRTARWSSPISRRAALTASIRRGSTPTRRWPGRAPMRRSRRGRTRAPIRWSRSRRSRSACTTRR